MKSITLALGEQKYEVKELTIGQIETIQDVLFASSEARGRRSRTNRDIIAAALSADHPEVSEDVLKGTRVGSVKQLVAAAEDVLLFGGFAEEKPQGEAVAGTSSGEQSSPASPQP